MVTKAVLKRLSLNAPKNCAQKMAQNVFVAAGEID